MFVRDIRRLADTRAESATVCTLGSKEARMAHSFAAISLLLVLTLTATAHAQGGERVYLAASTGVDGGSRGLVPAGRIPSVSGILGIRIASGWSADIEVERAFRDTVRSAEAVWISLAPPNAARDEIERLGIRARFERTERAGAGLSALATWRTREPRRLNGAVSVGVSTRAFDTRVVRTITAVPAGFSLIDPRWPGEDSSRTRRGSGITVGGQLIAAVTDRLSIAPEVRFTSGIMTGDDPYRVLRAALRLSWAP